MSTAEQSVAAEKKDEKAGEFKAPTIKVIDLDKQEPSRFERHIFFDHTSQIDHKRYAGNFTYKKFTIGGSVRVGISMARRNGGMPEDALTLSTGTLNMMIAHLQVWFDGTETPPWAKDWDALYDSEIISALYKEGLSFEKSFRSAVG